VFQTTYVVFIEFLAGQSGRFAFGFAKRTFGLSYHHIDEPRSGHARVS
jgi:hypothetical protein